MSWSVYSNGSKEKVRADIVAAYAPGVIKAYLLEAVDAYPTDAVVAINADGHLYSGQPGDLNVTTAQIVVQRVLPVQTPPATEAEEEGTYYIEKNAQPTPEQAALVDHPVDRA